MMHGEVESKGCRLVYHVAGAGPPLVFIQGVGIHASGCNPQVEELSREFRCLTFDNRGIGDSQPVGAAPLTVEQMVEDTLTVMDAAGIESAHIAGHSLGGMVAQQLARRARERVLSLCLLCTSARGKDATRLAPDLIWLGIRSNVGPVRARRAAFLRIVLPDAYIATQDRDELAQRLADIIGHDLGVPPKITMKQMGALQSFDGRTGLGELAGIRTLVVAATHDRIFPPRFVKALADGIPGAKYTQLDGAHGVTIQRNREVNALLKKHILGEL
jgi:pimeloyl-ACP methyl ester carboxylesterase